MLDIELAVVHRGWVAESHHRGRVVVTRPDGSIRLALGSQEEPTLPRSALKPFQVIAMVENGLDLHGELLALAGASHAGEDLHLTGAEEILAGVGLSPADFVHTPDLPVDEDARMAWLAAGRGREPIAHNCSGKHAAMLRTCVRAGWPSEGYRDPQHPLQRAIRAVIADYCQVVGEPVVDGCTAPAFATTLSGLARGFGRLAAAAEGPARRLADAFREHPEYMSGTKDPSVALHRAVPGLVAKLGAEGILAVGLPDGTGISFKLSDGMGRGRFEVAATILGALGHQVSVPEEVRISAEFADALAGLGS